jgi:hypothetical protein
MVFFTFLNTLQDTISIELIKYTGLGVAWYIDNPLAYRGRRFIKTVDLFILLGKSLHDRGKESLGRQILIDGIYTGTPPILVVIK